MLLNQVSLEALQNTLSSPNATIVSPSATQLSNVMISNRLAISVVIFALDDAGRRLGWHPAQPGSSPTAPRTLAFGQPGVTIAPNWGLRLPSWCSGGYAVVLAQASGAFVCVIPSLPSTSTEAFSFTVSPDVLLQPNCIGPVPVPGQNVIVPPDSPRVLVGCGKTQGGLGLLREQFWQRLADSRPLAANETLTSSTTAVSGIQETTSTQSQLEASLGFSSSVGWGPLSTSISANLSTSSSTFQQVTVSSETTAYNDSVIDNSSGESAYLLYWQLMDIVTVLDSSGNPQASVVTAIPPPIIAKHAAPAPAGLTVQVPANTPAGLYRLKVLDSDETNQHVALAPLAVGADAALA